MVTLLRKSKTEYPSLKRPRKKKQKQLDLNETQKFKVTDVTDTDGYIVNELITPSLIR